MTILGLILIVVALGLAAYVVRFFKLPEPYGTVLQVVLLVALLVAIFKFATGPGGAALGL